MRLFIKLVVVVSLITGCASGAPQIMYPNEAHPLANTAVFSALAEEVNRQGQVISVDGQATSCWRTGCPGCVRVLPGSHTFKIRYSIFGGVNSYFGEIELKVPDMKAQHIYISKYTVSDNKFSASVMDVGNMPNFTTELKLKGVNMDCWKTVEFR